MLRHFRTLAFVAALAVCSLAASIPALAQGAGASRVPGHVRTVAAEGRPVRIIVGVRATFAPEGTMAAPAVAQQRGAIRDRITTVIGRLPSTARARGFTTIPFFSAEVDAATLDQLASDPDVSSIEEDVADRPVLAESVPLIGAPAAWSEGYAGSGWTVAVLDTGVDKTHPFLSGKVVSEACYSNANGGGIGASLCPGGASSSVASGSAGNCSTGTYEGCEHGTHVAGIAAGHGMSFSGVARDGGLISIQIFTGFLPGAMCGMSPCLASYTSDQIRGLERVLALNGTFKIAAVNMSLGGVAYDNQSDCDADNPARKAAIDNLRSVGIATVIASGNGGSSNSVSAPACISSAVSVGSTTKSDDVSSFTNAASFLSLLAPGESITSSIPGGTFAVLSGTSMAAPHVAGAWAVVRSGAPNAGVTQVLSALRSTGTPVTDVLSGSVFPRIQVAAALNTLLPVGMSLDGPLNGSTVAQPFTVAGWALNPAALSGTGVDAIHVWAFPSGGSPVFLGAASYGLSRPDVGAAFGGQFTNSGFSRTVSTLVNGSYTVVAYARSTLTGTFVTSRAATINVTTASRPVTIIDGPGNNAIVRPSFEIAGWAVDLQAAAGAGVDAVHIYAYPNDGSAPVFLGVATYGIQRPDIGSAFGVQFANSGYTLNASLTPGGYMLVVFARSTVSGVFTPGTRSVTVRTAGDPLMMIDGPLPNSSPTQPFEIGGWAFDRDAAAGAGVDAIHVWAFPVTGALPIFLGVANYGISRPDVGAVFGTRFTASGYSLPVGTLPVGTYDVAVYAHSAVTGTFNQQRVVRIIIR